MRRPQTFRHIKTDLNYIKLLRYNHREMSRRQIHKCPLTLMDLSFGNKHVVEKGYISSFAWIHRMPKWCLSGLLPLWQLAIMLHLMLFVYYCKRDFYSALWVLSAFKSLISYPFLNFQVSVNIFHFKCSHSDMELKWLAQGLVVRHCQTWDCIV